MCVELNLLLLSSLLGQVHHPGPVRAPLLPGEQRRPRGAGRGGRHGEVRAEALAPYGRHQEASRQIQRQQRHRVPVRALQGRPRGGGSGDGEHVIYCLSD